MVLFLNAEQNISSLPPKIQFGNTDKVVLVTKDFTFISWEGELNYDNLSLQV